MRKPETIPVVLIRHAQSQWNKENRFTGWADPVLTAQGRYEAMRAGMALASRQIHFDQVYSSLLRRAIETAEIILRTSGNGGMRIQRDWRLNERHYGALQGHSKPEMAAGVGEQQVWRWRRSYLDRPPMMAANDPQQPAHQLQRDDIPTSRIPNGESLKQTRERVVEFWNEIIAPQVSAGRSILISSHGNTLRALLMALDDMSVAEVESFEIPTGVPIIYRFDVQGRPVGWDYHDASRDVA